MTSNELKNTLNQEQIKERIAKGIRSGKLPSIILDDLSKRGTKYNVGDFYRLVKEVYPDYEDYLVKFYGSFVPYVSKT
ncbi:MAG: hypothetical protein SCH70_14690 [Candidatus Methanoperedens sp.]|nr:hypothetical protein [Candidatus Methanoperedens sp.]